MYDDRPPRQMWKAICSDCGKESARSRSSPLRAGRFTAASAIRSTGPPDATGTELFQ